jgi:NTP pyrophosphatase (non-canonical NTP hydrolase)
MKNTQKELDKLYKDCINTWGVEAQLRQAQEECAELIIAINHFFRNREGGLDEIIEESADVFLMVNQVMEIVGRENVMEMAYYKAERTNNKLLKGEG